MVPTNSQLERHVDVKIRTYLERQCADCPGSRFTTICQAAPAKSTSAPKASPDDEVTAVDPSRKLVRDEGDPTTVALAHPSVIRI